MEFIAMKFQSNFTKDLQITAYVNFFEIINCEL